MAIIVYSHMNRFVLLKRLNEILKKIQQEQPLQRDYDKTTQQVSKAVDVYRKTKQLPDAIDWTDSQIELFNIYRKLLKITNTQLNADE